ncbi:hypothetical protein KEM48_002664 [Puccinia striiformis f. sp. tritici PST-130]|nr:hypothetical protein KEM48_002664 [Puccinia striiformis f. sp. tritici PST-130]
MTSTHQSGLSQQQPQPKQNKKHQPGGVNKRRKVAKLSIPSSAQQSTSQFEGDYRGEESLIDLSEFLNNYPGLFNDNQPTNHQQQQQTTINYDQILSSSSASSESNNDPSLAFLNRLETTTTHQQQQQSTNNTLDYIWIFNPQQQHHHHHQNQTQDRLAQIIRAFRSTSFRLLEIGKRYEFLIDNSCIQTLWNDSKNLFISTTNQQNQEDQIESEYEFQRNLLTCIPILETLPIPGCIWRRSGEIYKTNSQFNSLIGIHSFPSFDLFSTTLPLQSNSNNNPHNHSFVNVHRLWDIDSSLNFLEKFNRIALDDGQNPQPGPTNPSNYTPKAHHQETESALSIDETSLYKNYTFVDPIHKQRFGNYSFC